MDFLEEQEIIDLLLTPPSTTLIFRSYSNLGIINSCKNPTILTKASNMFDPLLPLQNNPYQAADAYRAFAYHPDNQRKIVVRAMDDRIEGAVSNREGQIGQHLEPVFKVAEADEVQGVDGAQKLSVQKLLDASSTGATKQFAASVEFEDRFLISTSSSSSSSNDQEKGVNNNYKDIVNHFKEALQKKYGEETAEKIFSLSSEADAFENGLSGAMIQQVFRQADALVDQVLTPKYSQKTSEGLFYKVPPLSTEDRDALLAAHDSQQASESENSGQEKWRRVAADVVRDLSGVRPQGSKFPLLTGEAKRLHEELMDKAAAQQQAAEQEAERQQVSYIEQLTKKVRFNSGK